MALPASRFRTLATSLEGKGILLIEVTQFAIHGYRGLRKLLYTPSDWLEVTPTWKFSSIILTLPFIFS